jgi:hypothetical protein
VDTALTSAASPKVQTGWAQFQTNGNITGFETFHYQPANGGLQEAVVPLETRGAASYVLPYDNTNGYSTGIAVANITNEPITVAITMRDALTGNVVGSDSLSLLAQQHTSYTLATRYPALVGQTGSLEFDTLQPGQISVIGIRANANSAFTSIPSLLTQ